MVHHEVTHVVGGGKVGGGKVGGGGGKKLTLKRHESKGTSY